MSTKILHPLFEPGLFLVTDDPARWYSKAIRAIFTCSVLDDDSALTKFDQMSAKFAFACPDQKRQVEVCQEAIREVESLIVK